MSPKSSSSDASLQRGKACLSCRRRKMKCDGLRPVCTQCSRANRSRDCEYTDNQGRTRTQMLEEQVSLLENRIQQLQNPEVEGAAVFLHDPHAAYHEAQSRRSSESDISRQFSERSSIYSSQGQSPHLQGSHPPPSPSESRLSSRDSPHIVSPQPDFVGAEPWWRAEEPPLQISQILVNTFLPRANQLGFSLNVTRFLGSMNNPVLHPARPHPSLLYAIYLWGARLSSSEQLKRQQTQYLSRSIAGISDSIGSGTGGPFTQKHLQAVQAEVLLSYYFYSFGRFEEGRHHTHSAVSMALAYGLHKSSSARNDASDSNTASHPLIAFAPLTSALVPARDAIEEGERINLFWSVYILDRCWSCAHGAPSLLPDSVLQGAQIDAPWPLEMEEYELIGENLSTDLTSHRTIQRFLDPNAPKADDRKRVPMGQLFVQAAALFERSFRTSLNGNQVPAQQQVARVQLLNEKINDIMSKLPPIDRLDDALAVVSTALRSTTIVTYSLAHASLILLYSPRLASDVFSNNSCLNSAKAIADLLDYTVKHPGQVYLNPTVTATWMISVRILTREVLRVRGLVNSPVPAASAAQSQIRRIGAALAQIGNRCPVVAVQIAKIQEIISGSY